MKQENDVQATILPDVKTRLVYYIPGFDPFPVNRYREGYASEAKKQGEFSDYSVQTKRISTLGRTPRFEIDANIDGQHVKTEYRFLIWNDLVANSMNVSIWKSWIGLFRVGGFFLASGSFVRLLRLHWAPNVAGAYPFIMLPFQLLCSVIIAFMVAYIGASWLPGNLLLWGVILGLPIFGYLMKLWHKYDGKFLAYYVLSDLVFTCEEKGYTPTTLRERLDEYKRELTEAIEQGYDEILLVGHSSGAHLGVLLGAELIEEGRISNPNHFSLLTIGQAIPFVAYLSGATDLRWALDKMATQDLIPWVDFSAPSDGACFALHDPVRCSIDTVENPIYPRVLSAAFQKTLSPERFKSMKWRFFRLHFQYLCHFDRPDIFDYFKITAGPLKLWTRFGELPNSPSTRTKNLNKYAQDINRTP